MCGIAEAPLHKNIRRHSPDDRKSPKLPLNSITLDAFAVLATRSTKSSENIRPILELFVLLVAKKIFAAKWSDLLYRVVLHNFVQHILNSYSLFRIPRLDRDRSQQRLVSSVTC